MLIARIFGTRVLLNPYFLVLLALSAGARLLPQALLVFTLVFLHEFTHVLVARGLGLNVTEVELLPFGGVARVDSLLAANPRTEISVALAGPLSSAVTGLAVMALLHYRLLREGELVSFCLQGTWFLAGFNLLPAFPLDGGRILRALLVPRHGFRRATHLAVGMSRALALLLAGGSLVALSKGYSNFNLLLLAFFIFISSGSERAQGVYVFLRYLLHKQRELHQQGVIAVEHLLAERQTPLLQVLGRFLPHRYHLITVVEPEDLAIAGMTSESQVLDALLNRGTNLAIGDLLPPSHH